MNWARLCHRKWSTPRVPNSCYAAASMASCDMRPRILGVTISHRLFADLIAGRFWEPSTDIWTSIKGKMGPSGLSKDNVFIDIGPLKRALSQNGQSQLIF
jgi:hypothetical protein